MRSAIREQARRLFAGYAPNVLVRLHRLSRKAGMKRDATTPVEDFLKAQYRAKTGLELDLANPVGLSEKLNALKLRPVDPLQTICADKIRVREHVAAKLGNDILVPMIMATYRLGDINPRRITQQKFVLKTNHDFGGVVICRDRVGFDWAAARAKLADHLAFNQWHRHREPPYRDIRPGILVEEFMEPDTSGELREYKIFCFHGVPHFIMSIQETAGKRTKTVFDTDWRPLPVRRRAAPVNEAPIAAPDDLGGLLRVAETLSEPFDFCRVDLYENFGKIRFGEITFYPEGGMDVFEPPEWELRFGSLLRLAKDDAPSADRGVA
ncbi:ATP-grasp fold amidoligase family protein [Tabrizicola sp.]|uniref:ATP-grasp fold amidoligase family protein n=1 Tax=Tabrizicola sp. TaxID=2005166 RepID=UPI003F3404EA